MANAYVNTRKTTHDRPKSLGFAFWLLTTLTVIALTELALTFRSSESVGLTRATGANSSVVRSFYDAANEMLQTGRSSSFEQLVASDMVDHSWTLAVPANRDGLLRTLMSLHKMSPAIRLSPADITESGDRVMARVTVEGAYGTSFIGVPLASERGVWSDFEVFRVAGRQIIEHWSEREIPEFLEPLQQVMVEPRWMRGRVASLQRMTFPAGSRFETSHGFESRMIYVNEGTLTVSIVKSSTSMSSTPIAIGTDGSQHDVNQDASFALGEGDALMVPDWTKYKIDNDSRSPAEALVLDFLQPSDYSNHKSAAGIPIPNPGSDKSVVTQQLAGFMTIPLPNKPAAVSFGLMTLSPGADLHLQAAGGPLLIAVRSGELDLESLGTPALIQDPDTKIISAENRQQLPVGGGALLLSNESVFRNTSELPVVLWAVSIIPQD